MAIPPSKRLCVHLPTSSSVPGIGGVLCVADAGFALLNVYTPKQFIAVTINQKIRNKHLHKKSTSPLQSSSHSSANVSPPHSKCSSPSPPKVKLLESHFRCVKMGLGNNQTRLLAPIHSQNYLDDWHVLAQSKHEQSKSSLSPNQRISFLGAVFNSAQMRA